jgi:ribosomal protection tetracycline resistance protein
VRTLNLGILAHVDAGKTSLTERLLFNAGVIGSVDAGTTQTDSLALERQRGITIKSAVVSFPLNGRTVNLIDTPGHPDFIAEVERAMSVLDGAVLVVSAVEGVQPQTTILMRALKRLRVPTLMFVNKIDRGGADCERSLQAISQRLTPAILAMGRACDLGTRAARFLPWDGRDAAFTGRLAELLAEQDVTILAAFLGEGAGVPYARLQDELATQTARAVVHPVFFGSALTGAGVDCLMSGIAGLLPSASLSVEGPVSGRVFKVERDTARRKIAYVRMFSGTVRTRSRVRVGRDAPRKVTSISVFDGGVATARESLSAGQIGKLGGLAGIRVGDAVGTSPERGERVPITPPTLETVVVPRNRDMSGVLRAALALLAEQDPLINVRQDDSRGEISLSLHGEVQKEVIAATLASEFGVAVSFRETTTVYVERPIGTGSADEQLHKPPNPFLATVGLRLAPGAAGSGVVFHRAVELGSMPFAFFRAVEDTVRRTLREGLCGWEVTDCTVTMTHSGFAGRHSLGHARFTKSLSSTGEDFRKLTPLVVMAALQRARTVVCQPIHRFRLDAPAGTLPTLLPALTRLGAVPTTQATGHSSVVLQGDVPAGRVHALRQWLPVLTHGEGVVESTFDRYEPVTGTIPTRPRTDNNPLDREAYLLRVVRGMSRR